MPYAPSVELPNGNRAIPQHYLRFEHSLSSIQQLIHHIDPLPLTPIFADRDDNGCYLQVGIIGKENYDRSNTELPTKIVYGRKWRIDSNTPTSEIIQTAFLAVQKVWEHEIREFFIVKDHNNKTSAPFSCHHDLPLMANNRDLFTPKPAQKNCSEKDLYDLLKTIRFKTQAFIIDDIVVRKKNIIVDIRLEKPSNIHDASLHNTNLCTSNELARFADFEASLILSCFHPSECLYALMDALIAYSNQLVENSFTYQGFARFSRNNDPRHIAALSIASRPYAQHMQNDTFASTFQQINYENDACRVPHIGEGALAEKNRQIILSVDDITGHLPNGFSVTDEPQASRY